MDNSIAYCTMVIEVAIDNGYAYEWMARFFADFLEQESKSGCSNPICHIYVLSSIRITILFG